MLKYTLCLIKNGDQFLLLNRLKKPQMGTWNGVGGKIESGETPRESVIREIFEETGILLKELVYAGNVIFKSTEGRVVWSICLHTTKGLFWITRLPNSVELTSMKNQHRRLLSVE